MTTVADVAIVGGGVIGLSVARDLRLAGIDAIVLERDPAVGQRSSSRANGGVRAQFTTAPNIAFSRYSIREFEQLEEATGGLLSFHQKGYLLFTGTELGERNLRAAFELQRSLGVETEWVSPGDVRVHAPLVRIEGLRAGTFHAKDGFLDPHGVVSAMAQEARRLGARIETDTEVTSIERRGDGAFAVDTSVGAVSAGWVVNAAGPHAAEIAAMLGLELPVEPVRRNLAFAPAPPGPLIPMCVDLDSGVLVRREVSGGYLLAYSDPDDPPGWDTSLDPRFLPALAARIGRRFPSLEALRIDPRQCWAGLYPETPDHHAIVGAFPEAPRFVQCAGFGGHGLMHAPAAGRAVAELIADASSSTFDLHPLRPSRFAEGDLVIEGAVF